MSTEENETRDEVYARMCRHVADEWMPHIVRTLTSTHVVALDIIVRRTIGEGLRSARISPRAIARAIDRSPARTYQVLDGLQALGVIAMTERRQGRSPRIAVVPDWSPHDGHEMSTLRDNPAPEMSGQVGISEGSGVHSVQHLTAEMSNPPDNFPVSPKVLSLESAADPRYSDDESGAREAAIRGTGPTPRSLATPRKENPNGGHAFDAVDGGTRERKREPSSSKSKPSTSRDGDDGKGHPSKDRDDGSQNGSSSQGDPPNSAGEGEGDYTDLMREIEAMPEHELTDVARDLGAAVVEKLHRIQTGKANRLALHCLRTGNLERLGNTVAELEDALKGRKIANAWAYLVKSLHPLSGSADGPQTAWGKEAVLAAFEGAYEAVQGMYALNGAASKNPAYGVKRRTPTAAYVEYFGDAPEPAPRDRPAVDTEDYIERL